MFFKDYLKMNMEELELYADELCTESKQKRLNGKLEESNILKNVEERVRDRINMTK